MFKLNVLSHLLVAFLLVSHVNCDWSWGSTKKGEVALEAQTDDINPDSVPPTSFADSSQNEARSSSIDVPQAVLPLEEELTGDYSALEVVEGNQDENQEINGEEGRSSRFLGIPGRLCKLGVKGLCEKQKYGYPPVSPNHYGNSIPSNSYNNYVPNVYPPLSGGYPSLNGVTPKPSKGLFSSLFKNKKKDTIQQPTYIPPPTYGAPKPTYGAPQPIYKPPVPNYHPKPAYQPPVPSYGPPKPKPHYHQPVHKISYKQPPQSFDTPKPNDVIIHQIKGQHSIPKQILSHPVHPSKVQHIHTHTHIYQQNQGFDNPGFDIRDTYNHPRDDSGYQSASQIQSVKTSVQKAVPFPSINIEKVFLPQAKEKNAFTGPFIPSQEIPFSTNQGKRHISDTTKAFNNNFGVKTHPQQQSSQTSTFNSFGVKSHQQQQPSQTSTFNSFGVKSHQQQQPSQISTFNSFGVKSHPQQQSSQTSTFNSFGVQSHQQQQPSQKSTFKTFGVKSHQHQQPSQASTFNTFAHQQQQQQSFQTSIDKLTASFAQNGLQNAYPEDCQCIARQYCALEDLVARTDTNEIRHLLDARNEPSEVISNSTLPDDYFEYDYLHSDVNFTYDDEIDFTTVASETDLEDEITTESLSTEATTTTTKSEEVSRVRREAKEENKNATEELQGRQLTGFAPGNNGCGPDYVCCRRPVYIAAKRSDPICGRGNPSIHGRVASFEYEKGQSDFGEYPWQAAILRDEGPESMFVCGATLIDDRHVLTAAHCVNDLKVETLKARLGEWDVNRDTEFYNYIEDRVTGVFIHPEFYKGNLYNDIAVLRLANYVDIDSHPHISPVCLPPPNTDFTNYRCHVTGWGKDAFGDKGKFQHILKELEIPVVDRKTCEFALQSTRLGRDYKLHKGFLCAGGEEGKDACKGDGGGPLVCATSSKTFQLAGVVSWGIGCGQKGVPGVYVNIPYYADWIRSTTRI